MIRRCVLRGGRTAPIWCPESVPRRPNASPDEVLDLTLKLIAKHGVAGLTVEMVATTAGVSKATIYRRWPSRAALIHETIARLHRPPADPDTGSFRGDVMVLLKDLVAFLNRPDGRRVDASFIEASARDPELETLRRKSSHQNRLAYERAIGRAIERGELPPNVDRSLVTDMLIAPFLCRQFVDRSRVKVVDIGPVIDVVMAGFAGGPS